MESQTYVYQFEEADGRNKQLFGGKGAGLAEMTRIGLPVPPGFVITTEACQEYYSNGRKLPENLMKQVHEHMRHLEHKTGKVFGHPDKPLLVSVRSGAAMSMPGMMDTILNLGLNDQVVEGLGKATDNPRFAYDAYRRFIQLFGKIAMGLDDSYFDVILNEMKQRKGAHFDTDLDAEALRQVCDDYKKIILKELKREFPQDPEEQIEMAVEAVFRSWMGKRSVDYRREFKITPAMANGTAVNVCTMVFGNLGNDSGTGVAFTRDPGTGENVLFGEYLMNAQGEDVVAGIRTPKPVARLREEMPARYDELEKVRNILESHYHEVQDFEFTIERGKLYMLQTRNGKMNATALVKTSRDMVQEGLLTKEDGLLRISPEHLEQLLHRRIDTRASVNPIAQGIPASPGAAAGKVVFDADEAEHRGRLGEAVILVREETKPEDIHGFFQAKGILTSRGGKTSHAAVVARGMGKPCVVGCEDIHIDEKNRVAIVKDHRLVAGDVITIDGGTGVVYLDEVPTVEPEFGPDLKTILLWADEVRSLGVRANADTPEDAAMARSMGAEGIGLCRTERMFNALDRLPIVREMILADTAVERQEAINKLLPMQKGDFKEIFKKMDGLPVTIRLLDPPLHEFLPSVESLVWEIERLKDVKKSMEDMETIPDSFKVILEPSLRTYIPPIEHIMEELSEIKSKRIFEDLLKRKQEILRKVRETTEVNPMLGHRGVRLGIKYPEIYQMQIQAILEAAVEATQDGVDVKPEIMVPQVCTAQELKQVRVWVDDILEAIEEKYGMRVAFQFGTMIEVVRACMRAGRLAKVTDFFSFGTNDLTQATFSFSREDAEAKFLPLYNEMQILMDNPFEIIDIKGVGRLMKIAIDWGRKSNPKLKVGICGEHGGNPRSIEFCHTLGLNYVSCSAYRVPIARLTAAQAKLREMGRDKKQLEDPDYPFNVFF
jgi:pyruvate,orthophosphate dikinase